MLLSSAVAALLLGAWTTSALPQGHVEQPVMNPEDFAALASNISLGATEYRAIECQGGGPNDRPHTLDCVKALLTFPTTPIMQTFGVDSNPPTLPFSIVKGRCHLRITEASPGISDQSSWQYAQIMGIFLMSTCKYAFGQQSRTAGALIFGKEGGLLMKISKTPKGGVQTASGGLSSGRGVIDDDDEVPHDPRLQALLGPGYSTNGTTQPEETVEVS